MNDERRTASGEHEATAGTSSLIAHRSSFRKRRILVLSRSVVGSTMSAPGIRAYHMAQVLGRNLPEAAVTLAAPAYSDLQPEPEFSVVRYSRLSLPLLFYRYDIVISLSFPPLGLPALFSRR